MAVTAAPRVLMILLAGWAMLSPGAAVADDAASPSGMLDTILQTLDLKAKPADPPADFVRKTRPDPARLDFMQSSLPHKVSPLATKTPAEVQAAKDALDAAHERQLAPAPPPLQLATPGAAKPAPRKGKAVSAAKPPN